MLTGNVLITGGSGTLGNAIVRRCIQDYRDCKITIYSRSELLQSQMRAKYPDCRYVLGDVRDYDRLAAAVAGHSIVVHAAAMKRIPECESNPGECYQTNVLGSMNVARACVANNVRRCIGISTDKACRAITQYGASKLMMEKIFQSAKKHPGSTVFALVRYGNVLASRGSVIPIWSEQYSRGDTLTLTNASMTRFWLTPNSAVDLIDAAMKIEHGTILVPKAKSMSIGDMAQALYPGVMIAETGLRSIEKMHEDLVHEEEPSTELDNGFIVGSAGRENHSYTSDSAERLSRVELLAMLEEVEYYE